MKQKTLFASARKGEVKRKRKKPTSATFSSNELNLVVLSKINQRERQIMVHSYLYYEMDKNIIQDSTYDRWMRELVQLRRDFPNEYKQSCLYEEFKNFEGSTGMGLPYHQSWVVLKAKFLLDYRGGRSSEK